MYFLNYIFYVITLPSTSKFASHVLLLAAQLFSYYMKSAHFQKSFASAQNLIIRQENVIMPLLTAYHS